jgi:ribosomal protein L21E
LDSPKFQYELFQPNELEHIEAPMPQFKVGDRVRIENCPGYLQGELGCIHKVVSASEYLVRCDNGSFPSVHASWVKPAPQFKDGQRVRVRATGQVARIGAVLADGRFMVEGSAYGAVGLEPAPFKVGDRVRWKLSSSLPFCHGQVEYLSDERAGVQTDGQFVEVAERLLEAEPDPAFRVGDRVEVLATGSKGRVIKGQGASGLIVVMMESSVILYLDSKKIKFLEAMPMFRIGDRVRRKSDGAEGEVTQVKTNVLVNAILDDGAHLTNWKSDKFELLEPMPTFRVGDRVKWKGTAQTGTVSGVFAFGKLDVALDSGGWLSNYSPDGFELLEPAEPRTFIKHFLERVRGQEFTHEEAELLRTHIAIRERTPKPTELRCPFCGGTGSLSRNGNLWRLECIGCGAEVTAAANEDCKSKWGRRS